MCKKILIIIIIIFEILLVNLLYLNMEHSKIDISNDVIKLYEEQTLYSNIENGVPLATKKEEEKRIALINIKAGEQIIQAEIYDNLTARSFLNLLPLEVSIWHPAEIAKAFAESEFERYRVLQDRSYESDFDRLLKESTLTYTAKR